MDKKSLIGVSICAVVLLVLGSLSNVVGYQSVKPTVNDSPLFKTRTQRATNQQQNILTSQYLGMGEGNFMQFPMRDSRTEQLKKAIEFINKMDDKSFERFTELCIQRIRQDKSLKDTNPNDILKALYVLKTKKVSTINSFINKNNQDITSSGLNTICIWFLGCIPYYIITLPFIIILLLIGLYLETHPTTGPGCWSHNYLCNEG
jgi:hypothetical protein